MDLFHGLLLLLFKCDEIRNRCYVQLSNAQEKNPIPQQESNPGPSRYRYDAPASEQVAVFRVATELLTSRLCWTKAKQHTGLLTSRKHLKKVLFTL